jgi:hypothetical protein
MSSRCVTDEEAIMASKSCATGIPDRRARLRTAASVVLAAGLLVPASAGPAAADPAALLQATPCGGVLDPANTAIPGFLRKNGTDIAFDHPNATLETGGAGINDIEMITGTWVDGSPQARVYHGFLCDNTRRLINIEVPGAMGTGPNRLNNNGWVVGRYSPDDGNIQANPTLNGFLWNNGTFTFIDIPGTRTQTVPWDVNDAGMVVGEYMDTNGVPRGFSWQAGQFLDTNIVHPDAGTVRDTGTAVTGINNNGVMVGYYIDNQGNIFGFVRGTNGVFQRRAAPTGAEVYQFADINDNGQIVGNVIDVEGQPPATGFVLDNINDNANTVAFNGAPITLVGGLNNDAELIGSYSLTLPGGQSAAQPGRFKVEPSQRLRNPSLHSAAP